ncbi:ABC-type nitrate/sulfonate/bicarbonate transport system permease component [Bradyrhizobium sp. i1.7.7]
MPNLLAGNVEAAVVYSPLSFQISKSGEAKTILDYATAVPPNLTAGWIVLDKFAEAKPQMVQKAVNALYGAVAFMRANRDVTVKLIAELYEMPPEIAGLEYDNTIMKLETSGDMGAANVNAAVQLSLDLAKLGGLKDIVPVEDVISAKVQAGSDQVVTMQSTFVINLARIAIIIAVLALWEVLSRTGIVNPRLLPSASDTFVTLGDLLQRAAVRKDLMVTATEVLAAFALAVPFGAVIGFLVAENRYFADVAKPLLFFAFSIPKSIFLPMFILVFGVGFAQKVGFGFFSTIFIVIMSTTTAVESVKVEHLTVARSYGATPWQTAFRVYLPSMLPVLLEALRISMIFNLTGVILAEMYASRDGIGHQIATWGENFQMKQLLAGVVMVAAIAMTFNELVRWMETRCSHWRT